MQSRINICYLPIARLSLEVIEKFPMQRMIWYRYALSEYEFWELSLSTSRSSRKLTIMGGVSEDRSNTCACSTFTKVTIVYVHFYIHENVL